MKSFDQTARISEGISLLEASAGTGKTHSITSMVLLLVAEEEVPLEKILIVTFTEAATAELRDRVRQRLRAGRQALIAAQSGVTPDGTDDVLATLVKRAKKAGRVESAVRSIARALERYDSAEIRTIHGFCQTLLRDYAFECAAEMDADLLTDPSALLDEIARDFWACEVAPLDEAIQRTLLEQKKLSFKHVAELVHLSVRYADAAAIPQSPDATKTREIGAEWNATNERCLVKARRNAKLWNASRDEIAAAFKAAIAGQALNKSMWNELKLAQRLREADAWAAEPTALAPDGMVRFGSAAEGTAVIKGKTLSGKKELEALHKANNELLKLRAPLDEESALDLLALQHRCVRYAREQFAGRKRERRL
ncbi:MAG: UvrD-helicase domain-containing protein, partial [Gemmatimonadaceae bacterium]